MIKRRASDGGGFIAQMEVFHQLHCLDTLRQGMYFNYDYYHENRKGVWGLQSYHGKSSTFDVQKLSWAALQTIRLWMGLEDREEERRFRTAEAVDMVEDGGRRLRALRLRRP